MKKKKIVCMIVFVSILLASSLFVLYYLTMAHSNENIVADKSNGKENNGQSIPDNSIIEGADSPVSPEYATNQTENGVSDEKAVNESNKTEASDITSSAYTSDDGVEFTVETNEFMPYVPDPDGSPIELPDDEFD